MGIILATEQQIKSIRISSSRTLDTFDFKALSLFEEKLIRERMVTEYLERGQQWDR